MKTKLNDPWHRRLKFLMQQGEIRTIEEFFQLVPRTRLAREANINYVRMRNKVINPEKFTVKEILTIARIVDIEDDLLYKLISASTDKNIKGNQGVGM